MREYRVRTSSSPRPLPFGRWVMTQRWNDLLFAHWPVPPSTLAPLLPPGVHVDTYQGSAWLGVVPFWMDRIKFRGVPPIPFAQRFPELNLRTYVRDQQTNMPGVYFLSLEAGNPLAVLFARTFYNLPYHWAEMQFQKRSEREFSFYSRRRMANRPVLFKARYRGLGPTRKLTENRAGSLEFFLTERYHLFTMSNTGQPMRASIHHIPSPLEEAEAEIEQNDLASAMGLKLPGQEPVLHYSRRLAVYVWQLERMQTARSAHRIPAEVMPSV